LLSNIERRIQGSERFLKDDRYLSAPDAAPLTLAPVQQLCAFKQDAAAHFAGRARDQTQERHSGDTFAAAGFTDYAQGFFCAHLERHVVDSRQHAPPQQKFDS
jgi:hypothetical protein